MDCRNSFGMTLVELLVAMSIALFLMLVVVPDLRDFIRSAHLTTQVRSFMTALNFSRTHALKRNREVIICVLGAQQSCSNSGRWEDGWLTYIDKNRNRRVDAGEVIRVFEALPAGYRLRSNVSNESLLLFYPNGAVRKGSGGLPLMTLALCAADVTPLTIRDRSREIVINATGRMRMQRGRPGKTRC